MRHDKALEIVGIRQFFNSRGTSIQALSRIDLVIEPGQFVCLAGPSGCGKTTLLRLIAGFMKPTEGKISIDNVAVTKPGADRGVVFQQPTLYPWFDVTSNVALGLKFGRMRKAERTVEAKKYIDLVGLSEFSDRMPYELSGGMQQRCQLARVLANDPEFILMDEPFGALDALTRERLQNELLDIWRKTGKTILFITHSVDEAVFLGSRVLVMSPRPGKILFDEPAIFSKPGESIAAEEIRSLPAFLELRERVRSSIQHSH